MLRERLRLLAFGLAGGIAGVSSLLVVYDIGFDPNGGMTAVLLAVVGWYSEGGVLEEFFG